MNTNEQFMKMYDPFERRSQIFMDNYEQFIETKTKLNFSINVGIFTVANAVNREKEAF